MALAFLPAAHITRTFEYLVERANNPELHELINYIRTRWIEHAMFKPECWSVFRQTVRTNNDVEGVYFLITFDVN